MKVPTRDSQESLQPTMIDPNVAAQVGQGIIDVSQGLSGLGEQIQKMNNKRQTFKAETMLANAHNENWKMVNSDPDLDHLEENLDKATQSQIQDAARFITDPNARNAFVEKATLDTDRRSVALYHTIAHRQSVDYKNSMVNANDADANELVKLADPKERDLVRQKIIDRVNDAKGNGHIDPLWADHYLDSTLKHIDIKQVSSDIELHPEGTLNELNKGDKGLYSYLSADERSHFVSKAEQKIKKQELQGKQEIKNVWDSNAHELQTMWNARTLTKAHVEELAATGRIDLKTAKTYMRNLGNPKTVGAETDPDTYLNLISYIADPNISTEKKRQKIVDANTDRLLDGADAEKLYTMHILPVKGKYESVSSNVSDKSKYDDLQKMHGNFLSAGIGMIKRLIPWSKERQASASKMFVDGLQKEMPPETIPGFAYEAVKKQRIMDKPEMLSYPESGQQLLDEDGNIGVAYPDGRMDGDNQDQGAEPNGF